MSTNDYSKNIVYLSKEQYQELITNETLTVNGQTITYNDNDIYVTPQAEPITDVKLAGTSIGSNGVANIPVATASTLGVIKPRNNSLAVDNNGELYVPETLGYAIPAASNTNMALTVNKIPQAVYHGLAKAAGDTTQAQVQNANELNNYTDTAKQKIQNMLGITDILSTEESSTATAAHAINSTFMMNGKLHRATAAIAIGDAVEVGTNCEVVKADEVFVKNTDYATSSTAGIVRPREQSFQTTAASGIIDLRFATETECKNGNNNWRPLNSSTQHISTYYGLSKLAGVDLASETVTVGTYPETSKTAIRTLIGAGTPLDVQMNGTSIVNNGVANIPYASDKNSGGIVRANDSYGIAYAGQGLLAINCADATMIKTGSNAFYPIVPYFQHTSIYYGLSKLAGVDLASGSDTVGTYPETSKTAIRNMLGATSSNVIAVQDEQPTDSDTKVWLPETEPTGIEVPTYAEHQALASTVAGLPTDIQIKGTSIINNNVANIPVAGSNILGVVKSSSVETVDGIMVSVNDVICISPADTVHIKSGTYSRKPICTSKQHEAVFYGLAKAAGDTTQSISTNAVGTYTDDAKAAIQTMLGVPGDVQVNGTSVVSNGVANIPVASNNTFGVSQIDSALGISISGGGSLMINIATTANIKDGINGYKPIVPVYQHNAVFYGLAKAAGDTTQSASSNAVGTYTTEAKAAIHTMLGIDPASIAAQVDIPLVETVSGTTPTITGQPNVRYVCGEVSTISITPPASGSVGVIFESGSTATTMTVPSTVKWPAWFDAEALEANTTYEVLITDGVYGSVMTWAT